MITDSNNIPALVMEVAGYLRNNGWKVALSMGGTYGVLLSGSE
jgi:hypothetical protein